MSVMELIGRLHPLLVHFPIGLVLVGAGAELAAILTNRGEWRTVAIANVRVGAAVGIAAVVAGWRLALSGGTDLTPALEWHRWLGMFAAIATCGAALASADSAGRSPRRRWIYQATLLWAAALVAIAGHVGGSLVWGADFLRL